MKLVLLSSLILMVTSLKEYHFFPSICHALMQGFLH